MLEPVKISWKDSVYDPLAEGEAGKEKDLSWPVQVTMTNHLNPFPIAEARMSGGWKSESRVLLGHTSPCL